MPDKLDADLHRVHLVARTLHERAWYPAHDPRTETPAYKAEHHHLCIELDTPCWICGIRNSTGGKMETHHWHLEYALMNASDPAKVAIDFTDVPLDDLQAFRDWVDHSPENLLVLCDSHHRFQFTGVHAITFPIWTAQRYVKIDYDITAEKPHN